jgi:MFS transporter, putative metabolite:H+ symporter
LQQSLNYAVAAPVGTVLGSILCATLIDRVGRRLWFIAAFLLLTAGLVELWTVGADTAVGMLIGYGFCSLWTGSLSMSIFLYTAEIYPTRMRALGVSWATFWLRIAATAGPLMVGFILPRWGIGGVFLVFALVALIGFAAALFMIETSRRVLEEVSP